MGQVYADDHPSKNSTLDNQENEQQMHQDKEQEDTLTGQAE